MVAKKIGALENMVEQEASETEEFRFQAVGEQLRAERERQKLTLTDVAAKTRIPMRHLEAIESSNFSALPGATYTLGFARNYARALGLDATKLSSDLRTELEQEGHVAYQAPTQSYEPADVARIPPRTLAWTAAAVAVVLVLAYFAWRSFAFDGPGLSNPFATTAEKTAPKAAAPAAAGAAVDPNGAVVLTASDTVWLRIYDADGKRLYEAEMKAGDSYTVPADAKGPMINTGRPQSINVTIGGKPVPTLGKPDLPIKDVGVSAASLLARATEDAAAATGTAPVAAAPTAINNARPSNNGAPRRNNTARPAANIVAPATATPAPTGTAPAANPTTPPATGNPAN